MDILDMKSKTTKSETSLTIKIEDIWNSAMQQTMLHFSYSVDCYECTINRLSHQNNCRNRNVVPSFHYTIGSNVSDNNTPFAKIFKTFLKRSILRSAANRAFSLFWIKQTWYLRHSDQKNTLKFLSISNEVLSFIGSSRK